MRTVQSNMNRRSILLGLAAAPGLWLARRAGAAELTEADIERMRMSWRSLRANGLELPSRDATLSLDEQAWRERLTESEFAILREAGTEPTFASPLNDEKRPGLYLCAGCDLPVFSSAMKYDSGTGWPSFVTTIPGAFETERDWVLLVPRTEYHCVRCGGHHGHVFDDGPPPTGQRWCNNGAALRFVPADASV